MAMWTALRGAYGADVDDRSPVVVVVADSSDSVPTEVRPADPEDSGSVAMASYALELIGRFPDGATCIAIASKVGAHGCGYLLPGDWTDNRGTLHNI